MRRVLLAMALIVFALTLYADEFERAMSLLLSGQREQGISQIRALAEAGDVKAELFLGRMNTHPNALTQTPDPKEAMKWLSMASAQGSGEASAEIAELYEQGLGLPKYSSEANKWWELAAQHGWDQQELDLRCFTRINGPEPLTCEPLRDGSGCPAEAEMQTLREAGVTGVIRPTGGGGGRFRLGPKARALVVLDHPIASEVRLKQPRHTSVIYVQRGDKWLLLPNSAAVMDRPIVLFPQSDMPQHTLAGVKDVDGSMSAGGCALWK